MKRWIAILLTLTMLVAMTGCGNKGAGSSQPELPPIPPVEPSEPEPEPIPFTNPLTGEVTETDLSGNRPVAIMLNTLKKALPQSGPGSADLLIEIPEEGGITRIMAVFQDVSGVGNLGTVRSTREYFVFLAMGLDAMLAHCGASYSANDILSRTGYKTLNSMTMGDTFWRDSWRKKNVGLEHSLYTGGEALTAYLSDPSHIRTAHEEGFVSPYVFTEDGTPQNGQPANRIRVSFSGYKTTGFTYDAAQGKYLVDAFDAPYMDANTDTQVAVENVVVIPTSQGTKADGQLQEFDLSSGTGYFACGGQYQEIHWEKGDMTDPLVFTTTDGAPLELGVGNTYICICDTSRPITFE